MGVEEERNFEDDLKAALAECVESVSQLKNSWQTFLSDLTHSEEQAPVESTTLAPPAGVKAPEKAPVGQDQPADVPPPAEDPPKPASVTVSPPVEEPTKPASVTVSPPVEEPTKPASVTVSALFVKKPFHQFSAEYNAAIKDICRNNAENGFRLRFYSWDAPSFCRLVASLEYLNLLIELICASIPADGISDVVMVEKIGKLLVSIKLLHEKPKLKDLVNDVIVLSRKFGDTKDAWLGRTKSFYGDVKEIEPFSGSFASKAESHLAPESGSLSERAYCCFSQDQALRGQYLAAMIKFATRFARVCRVLTYRTQKNTAEKINLIKAILTCTQYVCVYIPPPNKSDYDPAALRVAYRDKIGDAFEALGQLGTRRLVNQNVKASIVVYVTLWHTIVAMNRKGWLTPELIGTVKHKLKTLTDSRCNKYCLRSTQESTRYVTDPLIPHKVDGSYMRTCDALRSSENGLDTAAMQTAQEFCRALIRYAAAGTPCSILRSPVLKAWMTMVQEDASLSLLP
jgi:hypothetical protein